MVKQKKSENMEESCNHHGGCHHGHHGKFYGLGVLGAAVYFISNSTGFWMGVVGVLKALVWPAFIVFEMLKFFGAN